MDHPTKPGPIVVRVLQNYWDDMFGLMLCNLLWLLAQILIIPGPPATAALFTVTNRVAHGSFARVSDFWAGFKSLFWESWKWGALNLLAILILGFAAALYGSGSFAPPAGYLLMSSNLTLLGIWLFAQLFAFPFWLEQVDKRIWLAARNAVVALVQNLPVTLTALLLTAAVLGLTVAFPVLIGLMTASFLTLVGNTVVVAQVEALREQRESDGHSIPAGRER
jgi:uncharacterized membrane protein YesL